MKEKFTFIRSMLTFAAIMFAIVAHAQSKVIGKVTADRDKLPLPGVSILVKGTNTGTVTDADGNFSLNVRKGDVLVFSFIGYIKQEIVVGNAANIAVALKEDATKLNEVLVIGYGTQSRGTVSSAVAKLDNQVIASDPRANVASALQGTVSGIQVVASSGAPGSTPLLLLRGGASINSPTSPLVVVDGIIRSYQDIPTEDIASVDILKDAASTAIYGARANNGVILITTKHGKSGTSNITYKFTTGFNQERQGYKYLDAEQYIYYGRMGRLNTFLSLNPTGTSLTAGQLSTLNNTRGYGLLTDPADLQSFDIQAATPANAYLLQQGWQIMADPADPGQNIIFQDHSGQVAKALFRNTQTIDHYVSASGGNDNGTYFASLGYYNEPGVIVGSTYDRYSGNFNGSYKVKPNVEITSGVTFSTSNQLGVVSGSDINTIYRTLSLWPTFNPWLDAAQTVPNPGNSITDGNPLYWLQKNHDSNEVDRFTANAAVNWQILPGLFFKLSGNGYYYENIQQSFTDATQLYSNLPTNTFNSTTRPATALDNRTFQQTYDATLNYHKSFGKNNFNFLLGAEYYDNLVFQEQVAGTGAPTDNITTANASTNFAAGSNYSEDLENRIISSFTRLNYDYDEKYLLTFVLREDGVSVLSPAKRIGYFPGMSAGWNMQKEDFFQNSGISSIISTIKPRISYGSNGNVTNIGDYDVQGIYAATGGTYAGIGGVSNTAPTLSTLQWETSNTKDAGIDLGFFHDRISLLFDYYDRVTSNLITNLQLPSYAGFSTLETNDGSLQNKGVEFTLKANILNGGPGGFRLDFGATASYDKNKILKLPYNGQPNNRQGGVQVYNPKTGQLEWVGGLQEGQSMGQIYGYKEVGIFANEAQVQAVAGNRVDNIAGITGPNLPAGPGGHIQPGDVNWEDVNGDGIIDSRDQVYLGNIFPTWTGGFNFNASYKGFGLYTRFDYSLGSTIYNDFVARSLGGYQGTFNYITEIENSWTPTNTNTMIPKVYYADQVLGSKDNYTRGNNAAANLQGENSEFYESGDYLACREITLSYEFPKALLSRAKVFKSARLYVSGENLFYIKKFSGPDPEAPVSSSNPNQITGVYQGTYPTPRTYVLGVQVSL